MSLFVNLMHIRGGETPPQKFDIYKHIFPRHGAHTPTQTQDEVRTPAKKKGQHSAETASSLTPSAHLDALSINIHGSLSEVYPDCGLGAVGETAGAEAVSQARLAHVRIADHYDLEDAGAGGRQTPRRP